MSRSAIQSLAPFEFRSDFAAPAPAPQTPDDRITISVGELAALLDDTRESTARLLRDDQVRQQAEAMQASSEALRSVLLKIVELANALEKASISEPLRSDAKDRIRKIAAELIDGQGNLFQS